MVLDSLSESLRSSLDNIRGKQQITKEDVQTVVKEVQRSLLQADVSVDIVKELSETIETRSLEEEPPASVTAREHILNIVYEELVGIIGDEMELPLEKGQTIILAGLQGSGKTTTAAKMAWWYSKKGLKPAIIQTDTFRPGAYEQSKQLAERAEVEFYGEENTEDPTKIATNGLKETNDADIQIIDTEGRHALEKELINELEQIHDNTNPDHTILVIDAAAGKGVKEQAESFEKAVGIDGINITKMDGTAKGGGALTAVNQTGANIAFLGTGEEVKDIERFETEGFVSRLLGMGDLRQLTERIERAQQEADDDWDPQDALEGEFTLIDMKHQLQSMNNMGPLGEILDMIPGMGGKLEDKFDQSELQVKQEQLREFEIIMDSMTKKELETPSVLNKSRKTRIARGSGKSIEKVNKLISQYNQMSKIFNQVNSEQDMQKMAQNLQQGGLNIR